jgi:outer membrane immunogenic protein
VCFSRNIAPASFSLNQRFNLKRLKGQYMKKLSSILAVAISLVAAPAIAADLGRPIYKAPVAAAVPYFSWSGFYIGGHAGYGWGDADYNFLTAGHYNLAAGDRFSHDMDGFMGGGHLGFNWQWGQMVAGLEGSFTWSDLGRSGVASPFFPATDTFRTRLQWVSTITPRLGYAANNWLLYVKGGVAFGEIDTRIQDAVDFNARSETRVGWTVGAGLEYAVTPNWIVGVEGNYYDFGSLNVNQESRLLATGAPAGVFSNHDVDVAAWSVLGRVSYKFGAGPIMARY